MPHSYPSETGCCPRFDPQLYDEKELTWDNKLFIKDRVFCLFYMPMNFGTVITRCMKQIEQAGACTPKVPLALSDHTSKWNMDLYVEVSKEIPGAKHCRLSGNFLSKVFEGPYKETGAWCRQMQQWVASKGKTIQKEWMYYTTCPKCAKVYGKNFVVIFAQI